MYNTPEHTRKRARLPYDTARHLYHPQTGVGCCSGCRGGAWTMHSTCDSGPTRCFMLHSSHVTLPTSYFIVRVDLVVGVDLPRPDLAEAVPPALPLDPVVGLGAELDLAPRHPLHRLHDRPDALHLPRAEARRHPVGREPAGARVPLLRAAGHEQHVKQVVADRDGVLPRLQLVVQPPRLPPPPHLAGRDVPGADVGELEEDLLDARLADDAGEAAALRAVVGEPRQR